MNRKRNITGDYFYCAREWFTLITGRTIVLRAARYSGSARGSSDRDQAMFIFAPTPAPVPNIAKNSNPQQLRKKNYPFKSSRPFLKLVTACTHTIYFNHKKI